MTKKLARASVAVLFGLALMGSQARATELTFFGGAGDDGEGTGLANFTTGGTFTITDALIERVTSNLLDEAFFSIDGGSLALSSGTNFSQARLSGGCDSVQDVCIGSWRYLFSSGGDLTITGYIPQLFIGGTPDPDTGEFVFNDFPSVLFSARFASASALLATDDGFTGRGQFDGVLDPLSIYVDPILFEALQLDGEFISGTDRHLLAGFTTPRQWTTDPDTGELVAVGSFDPTLPGAMWQDAAVESSTVNATAVPEPASLVLLGSGLLSIAGLVRRRKSS